MSERAHATGDDDSIARVQEFRVLVASDGSKSAIAASVTATCFPGRPIHAPMVWSRAERSPYATLSACYFEAKDLRPAIFKTALSSRFVRT